MLTPDEIEGLGWDVSARASQAEYEMLQAVERAVQNAILRGTVATAMDLQTAVYAECREIARKRVGQITEQAMGGAYDALREALEEDLERAQRGGHTAARDAIWAAQDRARAIARAGLYGSLRHMPLDMAHDAQREYLSQVSRHVLNVAAGGETEEDAVARAFRDLSDRGIAAIDYRSGARTSPDVAARRAMRTTIVQAGNQQTLDVCHAAGISLIEVSSHPGARPSHAEWQGRIYADPGPQTVDGTTYEDFGEGTGYYGGGPYGGIADRLCGVNCRHSFAPYVSGMEPLYSPDPDAEQGWDRQTVYEDTQEQRRLERELRKQKNRRDSLEAIRDTDAGKKAYAAAQVRADKIERQLERHVDAHPWLRRIEEYEFSRKEMTELADAL